MYFLSIDTSDAILLIEITILITQRNFYCQQLYANGITVSLFFERHKLKSMKSIGIAKAENHLLGKRLFCPSTQEQCLWVFSFTL